MTSERTGAVNSLLWGLFCSASWTWCIGMFLPFLMLQRHGWPGFWVFFVPNVVGCAGFGLLLSTAQARALRQRLLGTCGWFSLATIGYQAFFAGWMLSPLVAFLVVAGGLVAAAKVRQRGWLALSAVLAVVTAAAVLAHGLSDGHAPLLESAQPSKEPAALLPLAAAVALGFLACPFLDLTFHRARIRSGTRGSFLVFGIAFALTLLGIASWWSDALHAPVRDGALVALWCVQLAFTIGAHAHEAAAAEVDGLTRPAVLTPATAAWAALCGLALGWSAAAAQGAFPQAGEWTYLALLGLYGLVFPFALVLHSRAPRSVVALLILASAPAYAFAFIAGHTSILWAPIGVLTVLWIALGGKAHPKEPAAHDRLQP